MTHSFPTRLSSDLEAGHVLAGARRGVSGVAKAILRITAGKAWRARGNGYLVMDRRRGQPLGLGRDDRVDRPALQPDLAAQSVALLLVEIDVVVGIVEEALVLLDEIAADADRPAIGERDLDRAQIGSAACGGGVCQDVVILEVAGTLK